MSGSGPSVNVRLETTGAAKVQKDFENLENSGTQAGKRVQAAFAAASPELQKLAGAADIANRAFTGMGGSLGRVGDVASRVSGVAGGITAGFLALGAAAATSAVAIAKAGDSYTATMAKLTSASGGVSQAQAAYEGLFRLSQQTGVSVADSAAAFSRFAVAAKEVGATNEQVLRLTAGLQKAGIVSGASAEEAKAGALQLAQALASGVLQGDELRSVLENMPQLAQALAREFGVGIGQLRKMGEEGKLTADVVLPRLLKAAEDIGREFDKQPATMERSRDILLAATQDFGARLDKITKLSQTFAAFMLQGAAALRAMGDTVDQTPGGRTAAAAARLQALEGGIPAAPMDAAVQAFRDSQQYATAEQRRAMAGIPGRDPFDTTRQRLGASAGPRDASQDRARELAEARQELADAIAAEQGMLRDAREDRRADDEDAAAKRVEAARVQYKKIAEEIDKGLKTATSIEKKYQDERAKIQKLVDGQYWTEAQAKERLRVLDRERADALEALAKAENKGGEEAKKAAEKRDKAVLTLQEQVAAAQKARDATVAGEGASKAMALALEIENKIREAGIPITGKRTEAEQKAAEAIETNVRKLDELKESTKALEEAQKKATEAQKKFVDASRTALTDIPAKALDRLGDSLVDAFVRGEGAAVNFGNIVRGVIASAVADVAKLAVINPLMNSLFISSSGPRPTLIGASGGSPTAVGFGDLLGLGGLIPKDGLMGALGLGGSTGLLSTPLWGGISGGEQAFLAAAGVANPGAVGVTTLGGLLGGAGAGFGAGMLLNNLLGGKQTGGMIGSGLGGLAGTAIGSLFGGPLIGGLIGGLLGGAGGGLIGPGESVKGYGYQLNASGNGMLQMGKSFYNDTGAAAFKEAEQGIAALNAYLGARGLTVGGASIVGGNKDGADYSNATAGSFAEGVSQLYYHSNNAQLEYALAGRGNRFGSSAEMQSFVDGFFQIQDVIKGLTEKPLPAFEAQLKAVNDNFAAVTARAQKYSLSLDEVNRAQAEAVAALEKQRTEQLTQSDKSLEIRMLTAKGDAQGAALAQQAEATRQEINNFTAALDALGISAADKAARLVRLEEVQAAERAAIITRYGQQSADALRNSFESIRGLSASLSARGFAASGDNLAADLARQEAAAKQETKAAQNAITNVSREGAARLAALAQIDTENRARAVRAALDSEALLNSPEQGSAEERAAAFARNSDIAAGALRAADAARQEADALNADLARAAQEGADTLVEIERVQAAERAAIIKSYADQAAAEAKRQAEAGNALLRQLAYGGLSALSPSAKYFSAMTDLNTAKSALDAGGSLSDYTQVASAVLPVARDYLGTSTRYAGLAAEVGSVIASKGGDGNLAAILSAQANGMDGLQATLASLGTQQISVATNTLNEMRRLSSLIEAWITRNKAA